MKISEVLEQIPMKHIESFCSQESNLYFGYRRSIRIRSRDGDLLKKHILF